MSQNKIEIIALVAFIINVAMLLFIIGLMALLEIVYQSELLDLSESAVENWEFIISKIVTYVLMCFFVSFLMLWVLSWRYLVEGWSDRSEKSNKILVLLMIFIPIIGAHLLCYEHRKKIKINKV